MLFITDPKSPNPDELKHLTAWFAAHCAPGKRCDECQDVFGDPFRYARLVQSTIAPDAVLLYAVCEDCAERYPGNETRGFPNCHADAERVKDRIVVTDVGIQQVVQ